MMTVALRKRQAEAVKSAGIADKVKEFMLEWFTKNHSIYRTHSLTMESAREQFELVAMAYQNCVDETTLKVFDDFVAIDQNTGVIDQLKFIQQEAKKRYASVCYMPSVGMFPLTMWLANLRVAPLQMMALGHPATTHSDAIDYVVVEEDYVGDEACFSEKLLKLPSDGMPYRPSASAAGLDSVREPNASPAVVQIAMCATTMKLNPRFLSTCARIIKESKITIFDSCEEAKIGIATKIKSHFPNEGVGHRLTIFGPKGNKRPPSPIHVSQFIY